MKFIMHEDVPRWYHLFWDRVKNGLFIRIHRFFLENCEYKNFEPFFKGLIDKSSYLPLFDKYESRLAQLSFGINDSIVQVGQEEGGWVTYQINLPSVIYKSNFACGRCGGTGKRLPLEKYNERCYDCSGSGFEIYRDYIKIDEVCFSLSMLLRALEFPTENGDVDTKEKQLFTLSSCCIHEAHGHSVGGYASPEFIRFLESFSTSYEENVNFPSVVETMRHTHLQLYGEVGKYDRFGCYTRGGQIVLDCPGDACQIHTEMSRTIGDKRGEGITCHNLDTAMQQLTLLSGMGEISSLYDESIMKNA